MILNCIRTCDPFEGELLPFVADPAAIWPRIAFVGVDILIHGASLTFIIIIIAIIIIFIIIIIIIIHSVLYTVFRVALLGNWRHV